MNDVYMATYAAALPTPGEMRFITYLNRDVFTKIPDGSNISQTDTTVEGSDVFKVTATGYTHSKFYSTTPAIDDHVHGVTGTGFGAFMDMGPVGKPRPTGRSSRTSSSRRPPARPSCTT